jgi:hypothetical protein
MEGYSCHTTVSAQGIVIRTTDADGSVKTIIRQTDSTWVAAGVFGPALIRTIRTPTGTVDPQTQHDQSVVDVRAGLYGAFPRHAPSKQGSL